MTPLRTISHRAALAAVLLAFAACPARAQLAITALDSTAQSGGTGSFDIVLQDLGGTFQIGGFSLELSVPGASGITFTAVDTLTTDAYLFGALQSLPFSFDSFPNTTFSASDTDFTAPGYVTLNPGDLYGLAHVSYSVLAGTPGGAVTVSLLDVGGGTSLSDDAGNPVSFSATNGTITVQSVVPEPSAFALAGVGGALALAFARRTRV